MTDEPEIIATEDGQPIKHISQLDAAGRARADQTIRDAMLAIVVAQGKAVTIPLEALEEAAKIAFDENQTYGHSNGIVALRAYIDGRKDAEKKIRAKIEENKK